MTFCLVKTVLFVGLILFLAWQIGKLKDQRDRAMLLLERMIRINKELLAHIQEARDNEGRRI